MQSIVLIGAITIVLAAVGCGDAQPDETSQTPATPPEQIIEAPHWKKLGDSFVLPASSPLNNQSLGAAIERARSTMDEARTLWEESTDADRQRWAVKWAAPLEYGDTEYLWVYPTHWSMFRVEGILLNEPVSKLYFSARRGDSVSFPVEELCDWVRLPAAGSNGNVEGGFTNSALTKPRETTP